MSAYRLLADPEHRAVKRGALTSLLKFSDETYIVMRNEGINEATRQLDTLATPSTPPAPWTAPTWGGWPEVVASERGEYFGMGHVLEIGMVLADEGFAQFGWDKDA